MGGELLSALLNDLPYSTTWWPEHIWAAPAPLFSLSPARDDQMRAPGFVDGHERISTRQPIVNLESGMEALRGLIKSKTIAAIGFAWILSSLNPWAHAQNRGFPTQRLDTPLGVETLLDHWQAIQDELRATVGPKRCPEFEFHVFARTIPGSSKVEKIRPDQLPPRIVLVLGGLQGSIKSTERFALAVDDAMHCTADYRVAAFGYPNDGSIRESAAVLRDLLSDLHRMSPDTKVSIVAHSMGALVARAAIEPEVPLKACPVACVDQLIMLCPPNQGSVLAQYADALEFTDALNKLQIGSGSVTDMLESLVNDGLGEACEDLVPTSPFLQELNSRPRAKGVKYSIIAGTGGPITPLIRLASSVAFRETRDRTRVNRLPNARDLLDRADELLLSEEFAQGLGDGAVSLQSAALAGVSEFYTMPFQHGEWSATDKPHVQNLVRQTAALLSN